MSGYTRWSFIFIVACVVVGGVLYFAVFPVLGRATYGVTFESVQGDATRGEYVLRMSGCVACHTDIKNDGEFLAGGPPLATPFGTFYAPNITSDEKYGIGTWSLDAFFHALTAGLSPEEKHYYPAFPYTSYTKLRVEDIADLKAYLDTVPPIPIPSRPHDVGWPLSDRILLGVWKSLEFNIEPFTPNASKSGVWNRGAYLVEGPGHCAECHSGRNFIGGMGERALLGNDNGPNGDPVPALYGPNAKPKHWTKEDYVFYLQTGLKPDGDVSGGAMVEVIEESTSHMTDTDLNAIAEYLSDPSNTTPQR